MTKKEEIDKKGWILIKNVFSPEEIATFRTYVEKEKNHSGDLLSNELYKNVLTDERILNIFKECLGNESISYFGDSTVSINSSSKGFHKDSRDRGNKNSEELKDKNYSLLRLGVYLQDHSKHSKGLCLKSHSHLHADLKKGKIVNVKSEIGDVVIWKLTTTHSGNTDVISLFPNYGFSPRATKYFPEFMKQKSTDPRIAFFMSFGIDDHYLSSYIEYLKTRRYAVDRWTNSTYTDEAIADMEKKNVKVYLDFNIDEIDQEKITAGHQ